MKGFTELCKEYMENFEFEKDRYLINDSGIVYDSKMKRFPSIHTTRDQYMRVDLYCPKIKKAKHFQLHRLVAFTFLEVPENFETLVVDHINRNRLNNNYRNLRWATYSENANNRTKFYDPDRYKIAKSICKFVETNNTLSFPKIAKRFGVSVDFVRNLLKGKTYDNMISNYDFDYNMRVFKKTKKLNNETVLQICSDFNSGLKPFEIANKYNVLKSTVSDIINKRMYNDITKNTFIKETYNDLVKNNTSAINMAYKMGIQLTDAKSKISVRANTEYSKLINNGIKSEYTQIPYTFEFDENDINYYSEFSIFPISEVFTHKKTTHNREKNNTIISNFHLCENDVRNICEKIQEYKLKNFGKIYSKTDTLSKLANELNVSESILKRIASRKVYKHISSQYDFGINRTEAIQLNKRKIFELYKFGMNFLEIYKHLKDNVSSQFIKKTLESFKTDNIDQEYISTGIEFSLDDICDGQYYTDFK